MWEEGHDPMTQHRHYFPLCPFVLVKSVGNIRRRDRTAEYSREGGAIREGEGDCADNNETFCTMTLTYIYIII